MLKEIFLTTFPEADSSALDTYISFINSTTSPTKGYKEKHHILPKSIFPAYRLKSNHPWNQKDLSAEDHFKAHFYLCKILPNDYRLFCAFKQMWCNKYQALKLEFLEQYATEYKEAKEAFSAWAKTRVYSEETRKKMSESAKKKVFTEEHKKHMTEGKLGHKHSEETKRKISEAQKGKVFSEEHKKNLAIAQKNSTYVHPKLSEEHIEKLKALHTGRKRSAESRARMSEAAKHKKPVSEEAKRHMSEAGKKRAERKKQTN